MALTRNVEVRFLTSFTATHRGSGPVRKLIMTGTGSLGDESIAMLGVVSQLQIIECHQTLCDLPVAAGSFNTSPEFASKAFAFPNT